MIKGAFIGGANAFGTGPGPLAGAGLEVAAFCQAQGRGALSFPAGARQFGSAEELFGEPGLSFAAISLPPQEACRTALLALRRGLHVFCEPPFCSSSTEFLELREAAEKAGKSLFPAQPWERAPAWLALEKAVTRGLPGEINFACVRELLPGTPADSLAASPQAWRVFSLLLALARRPPAAIGARISDGISVSALVHFGGADGFAHLSAGAFAPRLAAYVSGDKGRVELDGNLLRLDISGMEPETVELSAGPLDLRPEWLAAEISDFRKEMEGGKPLGSGLRNARYCVKLMKNAGYSASVKSAAVPL